MIEVSRPEVLRVIQEFENAIGEGSDSTISEHPESSAFAQKKLIKHLNAMVKAVDDGLVSNPYLEDDENEFVSITTGEVFDPEIAKSIHNIKPEGDRQAKEFMDRVVEKGEKCITDTISHNNFYTFQNRPPAVLEKNRKKYASNNPTAIVTRYFLSIKDRPESEQDDFFKHESVRDPPSLSKNGQLYTGTKSAMIECLPCIP